MMNGIGQCSGEPVDHGATVAAPWWHRLYQAMVREPSTTLMERDGGAVPLLAAGDDAGGDDTGGDDAGGDGAG